MSKIYPSPCGVCPKRDTCHNICEIWTAWFSTSWEKLQKIYLGGSNEDQRN